MTWTTPQTWSVGESPTAAKLNTNIRDNTAWLHDSVPAVSLFQASQTIPNATWTALTFGIGGETFDTDTMHDTGSNTTRITLATAGKYFFFGQVAYVATTAGKELGLRFKINGVTAYRSELRCGAVNRDGTGLAINCFVAGIAGDYLELETIQESGGDLDTYVTNQGVVFGAYWLVA